jgi:Domain of unknown function (DUF5666)
VNINDRVKLAAPVAAAALLVGGGAVFAIDHGSGSTASAASNGPTAFARGGPGGGVAGEQRLQGTITAKTDSSITVKATTGSTATYTVNATSQIEVNGQNASLSDVKVGDSVFVHVYPSASGAMLVERLFDGALPSGGPGVGPPILPAQT